MSLSIDDFNNSFCEKELSEITLTEWKGKGDGVIHLRALPYSDVCRFETLSTKIARKKAVNMLSGNDDVTKWDEDLGRAEDYLIKAAVCDSKGQLLFSTDEIFNHWRENVSSALVNEIICHIENQNELYGGFKDQEKVIESYKKKSQFLGTTDSHSTPLS